MRRFDKHRREFYAELDEAHKGVRDRKTRLVERAEALAPKGEDGIPAYRDLLDEWKTAGRAGKKVDDALWARFKAAGDALYSARASSGRRADAEASREKIEAKRALLEEARAVRRRARHRQGARAAHRRPASLGRDRTHLPARDGACARRRPAQDRAGLRTREETDWKRNNPETKARANDMTRQLTEAIEKLEDELAAAEKSGDKAAIAKAARGARGAASVAERPRRLSSPPAGLTPSGARRVVHSPSRMACRRSTALVHTAVMASPFLYFADDRLSRAELTAACLDGDLVELGEAYIPADAVETARPARRLARRASSATRSPRPTSARRGSTARSPRRPARHTVQRAVARRLHRVPDRRLVYRDLARRPCRSATHRRRAGHDSAPARSPTSRASPITTTRVRRGCSRAARPGLAHDADRLARAPSTSMPHKRAALGALLRETLDSTAQDEVTR